MATLTTQEISESGKVLTMTAAAETGDKYLNEGNQIIVVKNTGESMTITVTAQVTALDYAPWGKSTKSNATLVVASNKEGFIGPFPPAAYNDADGYVQITYSAIEGVTVAVARLKSTGTL